MQTYPAGNCLFKVNNKNTRVRCEIYSKLTVKAPERRQWQALYNVLYRAGKTSKYFVSPQKL